MRYSDFKLVEYTDLDQEKDQIIQSISGMTANNKEDAAILDRIWKILNSGQITTNIDSAFGIPLADENMAEKQKVAVRQDMTKIIASVDSDYKTMNTILQRLEKEGGVVDLSELAKPMNTFDKVFGDQATAQIFKQLASYGVGKAQKGPGEYGLACLSNKVRLAAGEGDLEVDGIGKVELKAAMSSSGGRIGYGGGSQKAKRAVLQKYVERIPTVIASIGAKGGSLGLGPFMAALNEDLPVAGKENVTASDARRLRRALMIELLSMDMDRYADPIAEKVSNTEDVAQVELIYLQQNYEWYKNRDAFDALLLMSIPNQKSAMLRSAQDLVAFRQSGHAGGLSISVIPTQAGAGREQWAQLTLNKANIQ
jgi:hypothetical protein